MNRERALKVVLVLVGLFCLAGVYPVADSLWHANQSMYAGDMMLSLYVALGIFVLIAARNPSANRSLIAFAAWSSFTPAAVMAVMAFQKAGYRGGLWGVAALVIIGVALIVLAPATVPRSGFGVKTGAVPEESVTAIPDWRAYRAGEGDRAGRKIRKVYAVGDGYVIYFIGSELYYETSPMVGEDLGKADSALARINRLLDANPVEGTREYDINVSTLELAADAFEMFFCGERDEALDILNGIRDKLQAKEEGQRRLAYQGGTVLITAVVWIVYLVLQRRGSLPKEWYSWILAAALAMLGGLFSVCLTIGSLEVNVNQQKWFLPIAGATRSIVAFLAGIALLLAMRSKTFAGIAYGHGVPPSDGAPLELAEKFFCFLAGFSESFVPNILSKTADQKTADQKTADAKPDEPKPDNPKPDHPKPDHPKAAADRVADKAADKATGDKAGADVA